MIKNFLPNKFLFLSTYSSFFVLLLSIISGFVQSIAIFTLFPLMIFLEVGENNETFELFINIYNNILNYLNLNNTLIVVLIFMITFVTLSSIINFFIHIYSSSVSLSIARNIRNRYTKSITNASWLFFLEKNTGEVVNSLITESEAISSGYQTSVRFYSQLLQGLIILFSTFLINITVAISSLLFGLLIIFIFGRLLILTKITGQNIRNSMNSMSRIIIDYLNYIKPFKAMNLEKKLIPLLSREIIQLEKDTLRFYILKGIPNHFRDPILFFILAIGVYLIITFNIMSTILIVPMSLLFIRSSQNLSLSFLSFQTLKRIETYYESLQSNINKSLSMKEVDDGKNKFIFKKFIEFKDIYFSYGQKKIFESLNLKIKYNSFNLITGDSGSGKTTFVDLISRIYNPDKGDIYLDDLNIKEFKLSNLRESIGYVPQEFTFFNGTIKENITLGNDKYDQKHIINVLKISGANFVFNLKNGINTNIGEKGFSLSGGQRQRLSIARALIKNPQILILDEPTSNLDEHTTKEIIESLQSLKKNKDITILMISHDPFDLEIDYSSLTVKNKKIYNNNAI